MRSRMLLQIGATLSCLVLGTGGAVASVLVFDSGTPDGRMASASRPDSPGQSEIETADDFILAQPTSITGGTFTGLLSGGASASDILGVTVEVYRVFPFDSNTARTPTVPTRVNSPSDVAVDSRVLGSSLTLSTTTIGGFSASNSVQPGGIHPSPNQTTGGNGAVSGTEIQFSFDFLTPMLLSADHYFFVPQVQLSTGTFFWLSSPHPITTSTPLTPDLQAWARDAGLEPDWLRVGTDIVGGQPAPTFNFAFSLSGDPAVVPLPASLPIFLTGLFVMSLMEKRRRGRSIDLGQGDAGGGR